MQAAIERENREQNKGEIDGARIFIEIGSGNVLTKLKETNLKGEQFLNISCDPKNNDATMYFENVFGKLASHCIPVK